ncbi:hypothetical protein [Urbifossiella limnaea]|uniref:Uncharacterized protein n=1 Tax=Urbifossiella limnaea TaxID=2528023 RepID=A0A517Y3M5_9BACT|nr:hypothetical protein [Urbifossiella limnaea]QDU24322.1 hypothetical protein ETAA1_63360 [Urbifossiella limnaea]
MEALKGVLAVIGTLIGILSGLLTLYAKYLDLKARAAREEAESPSAAEPRRGRPGEFDKPPPAQPVPTPAAVLHARRLVKAPAIAIIVAGTLGLVGNLLLAAMAAADKSTLDGSRPIGFVLTCLSLSVGSAAAVWAGSNMLRARNYWLSVAGAIAVMPGSCLCVVTGVPIGIWSLSVLLKPEVKGAFT